VAENKIERELQKLKAMGITISSKSAPGHEADFRNRPLGIIQTEAEKLGMTYDRATLKETP
jgi:hypothetical protein